MMVGKPDPFHPACVGFTPRNALIALLLLGLPPLARAWIPSVELKFESGTANSPTNTAPTGGSVALSATTPAYVANTAISGGAKALDFGTTDGNFYADFNATTGANVLNAAKSLKSFTIAGWLNSRTSQVNFSGGRIVSWFKSGTGMGGVDLALRSDGALSLGVNAWNNENGVISNPNKVPSDANASYNNWRFFAVTYDGTQTTGNVKFYFGTNTLPASLDRTATYNRGTTSGTIAPTLTVGNVPSDLRAAPFHATFRGLIDQMRIYGSTSNNTGVLNLEQIQSLQEAVPLINIPGVVYDQWNGITGNTLSSLTSNANFPSNPSLTKHQGNFEGFEGTGDNYGARISGWVKAPETGSYTFWIVADDAGELRVSTGANPANKRLIASVGTYNTNNTSWTQYGSQTSEPVTLQANQYYFVEALMKEGTGGDFLRVGWQLPSGALERPIPQARLVTTPPDAVPFYPSEYPVYEPGTYVKKATMGWQMDPDNAHFSLKTEQTEALTAKDGTTFIPTRLFFGGNFPNDPNQNDLGFRWTRGSLGDIGDLSLETQGGRWGMKMYAGSEMEPHAEFNRLIGISGPDEVEGAYTWRSDVSLNYMLGSRFTRTIESGLPAGSAFSQTSVLNGNGLSIRQDNTVDGVTAYDSSMLTAGELLLRGRDLANRFAHLWMDGRGVRYEVYDANGGLIGTPTLLDGGGLTASGVTANVVTADYVIANSYVTTPKWKISAQIPDYVFEKEYPLKSLKETERFVKANKHLPEVPSAKEMSEKGVDLTDMNMMLLKKVEELTLHMIEMDKKLDTQRRRNSRMEREMQALRAGKGK